MHHGRREWSRSTTLETDMNNDICELSFGELEAVSGGKDKGASGGLDAAKSIDISKLLAALDKALAAARNM